MGRSLSKIVMVLLPCLASCYHSHLSIHPLDERPSISHDRVRIVVNSLGKADKWTQLNLTIDNASPYSLGLRIHNILLTDHKGRIFQPLDQRELIMKINQEAHKYSSLAMIPLVGSIVAIQQVISNKRAREDLDEIINSSLKDIDIPPQISIRGNIYFPAIREGLKQLTVYLKKENQLMKFCIPLDRGNPPSILSEAKEEEAAILYKQAFGLYKRGAYLEAIRGFNDLLQRFPQHELADNAQYWMGESYYALGYFHKAIGSFRKVILNYPGGNKAPDALLKLGLCYLAIHEEEKADEAFHHLVERFPASNAAQLARIRLREKR